VFSLTYKLAGLFDFWIRSPVSERSLATTIGIAWARDSKKSRHVLTFDASGTDGFSSAGHHQTVVS